MESIENRILSTGKDTSYNRVDFTVRLSIPAHPFKRSIHSGFAERFMPVSGLDHRQYELYIERVRLPCTMSTDSMR